MRIARLLIATVFSLGLLAAPERLCPMRDKASCAPVPAAEEAMPCHRAADPAPANSDGCGGMICCLAQPVARLSAERLDLRAPDLSDFLPTPVLGGSLTPAAPALSSRFPSHDAPPGPVPGVVCSTASRAPPSFPA